MVVLRYYAFAIGPLIDLTLHAADNILSWRVCSFVWGIVCVIQVDLVILAFRGAKLHFEVQILGSFSRFWSVVRSTDMVSFNFSPLTARGLANALITLNRPTFGGINKQFDSVGSCFVSKAVIGGQYMYKCCALRHRRRLWQILLSWLPLQSFCCAFIPLPICCGIATSEFRNSAHNACRNVVPVGPAILLLFIKVPAKNF